MARFAALCGWLAIAACQLMVSFSVAQPLFPAEKLPVPLESVVTGDFNGDGATDAAAVVPLSRDITIMFGRGDGGFKLDGAYEIGEDPGSLVTADFDRDGILDLAVFENESRRVVMLLGNGDGSFELLAERARGSEPLLAADFNGDSIPDLAAGNLVFLGEGNGRFHAPRPNLLKEIRSQLAGDVNGDDVVDLVRLEVCANRPCLIRVLLGQGNGEFTNGTEIALATELTTHQMVLADLNGDAALDMAATDLRSRTVELFFGSGDGAFDQTEKIVVSRGALGVAAADFDDDGAVDLAVTDGSGVSVLLGEGDGAFGSQAYFPAVPGASAILAVELDGTDGTDLLVYHPYRWNLRGHDGVTLLGDGDGGFVARQAFSAADRPNQVALADFNGDGLIDVAVGDYRTATLLIHEDGGALRERGPFPAGGFQRSMVVADFNSDQVFDLATAGIEFSTRCGDGANVLFGDGELGFEPLLDINAGRGTNAVAAGDLNQDGTDDLAVLNALSRDVSVLLSKGEAGFAPQARYGASGAHCLVIEDLDHDATLDLLVGGFREVSFFHGNGTGGFVSAQHSTVGTDGVLRLAVGDIDADGTKDIVVRYCGAEIMVHLGRGDGTFAASGFRLAAGRSGGIALGDVDGDGAPDLVVTERWDDEMTVHFGDGIGRFGEARTYATGRAPKSPVAYDFDGDGALDVLMADRNDDTVSLFKNLLVCAHADDVPPRVTIHTPDKGYVLSLPAVPMEVYFETSDDDGYKGDVVHERVLLDDCVLLDGSSYGDGDGLLSDEELSVDLPSLCEASIRCGIEVFVNPVLTIEAEDCAGNIGSAIRVLSGLSGSLRPGLCSGMRQPQ